jgi:hypothetical protein
MKTNKRPFPIVTICGMKSRINTEPDFQRPPVWAKAQKQLLIDTILRNYDIPKFYMRKTHSGPDRYDVVDGQQRLRAIWEFRDGQFRLPKDADPVNGEIIAGMTYEQLPDEARQIFDIYPLDVVVLEETEEDEVRELFLRLQNGTTLKAQEKRNAYPGAMRQFVRSVAGHRFFSSVAFSNSRFTYDLVAAQLICLELEGRPTNIKNADLNRMYEHHQSFDPRSAEARALHRTLDLLYEVFPEKAPELERYNVITLYCVMAELQRNYVLSAIKPALAQWFFDFESERRRQEAVPQDEADSEWVTYKEKISHSTDSEDSIKWRLDFVLGHLLGSFPDLSTKDNQREFTWPQRLAVFRRDRGICQLRIRCEGTKVTWDSWHCDHRVPWSKGGPTTVENGAVSCPACNLAKGAVGDGAPNPSLKRTDTALSRGPA